jgi:hypothetical protein
VCEIYPQESMFICCGDFWTLGNEIPRLGNDIANGYLVSVNRVVKHCSEPIVKYCSEPRSKGKPVVTRSLLPIW